MNLLLTRLSAIFSYVLLGLVFSAFEWPTAATVMYVIAGIHALSVTVAYYVELVNPTMWVRHRTSVDALQCIVTDGFNGLTNERRLNDDKDRIIGGQRQEDVISTSYTLDSAWTSMVRTQYCNKSTDYIYLNVPVSRVAINKAVTTMFYIETTHGFGAEFTVSREDANRAITEGKYTLRKPAKYLNIKSLLLMIGGLAPSVSYSDIYKLRNM